jgi:MFS family permease
MTAAETSGAAAAEIDPARKRMTAFLLCFTAFATMLGIGIITPALPIYAQLMGATGFWIGVIFSSFALSRTVFLPVFGALSDTCGRRRLLLIGLAGYSLFSALYVFADSVYLLTLIRFLHGIAAAMVFPIAIAYMGDIADAGEEGRMMGGFHSAAFLGMSFGPLISGVLMDYLDISAAFLCLSLITAVTTVVCFRFLPDYRAKPRDPVPFLTAACHPALRIPVFFYLVYSVAYATYLVYLPVITGTVHHFTGTEVGVLIFVGTIIMAGVQKLSGRIVDRSNKYFLLSIGIAVIAAASCGIALAATFAGYLGAVIVLGCGFGLSLTTIAALVTIAGRETGQGAAAGIASMAQGIGLMIVPVVFGIVMDTAGIHAVFFATAALTLMAAPVLLTVGRSHAAGPGTVTPVPVKR